MKEPWKGRLEPFRIYGNLYFIGTVPASSHLIDTGEGLIMIDSGYPQTLYLVLESIWELGFKPTEIKYIIHSHGHYDHLGATRALVELTGAKTLIGRNDQDYANGKTDMTYAMEMGYVYQECFEPDVLLDDKDTVTLGHTVIRCVHTPGHTPGTMSFFFDVEENGRRLCAGMHGGVGLNTMKKSYLEKYSLPFDYPKIFLDGLERLQSEKVDIFLGNHVDDNNTEDKARQIGKTRKNPFIAPEEWSLFLEKRRKLLLEVLAQENNNKEQN